MILPFLLLLFALNLCGGEEQLLPSLNYDKVCVKPLKSPPPMPTSARHRRQTLKVRVYYPWTQVSGCRAEATALRGLSCETRPALPGLFAASACPTASFGGGDDAALLQLASDLKGFPNCWAQMQLHLLQVSRVPCRINSSLHLDIMKASKNQCEKTIEACAFLLEYSGWPDSVPGDCGNTTTFATTKDCRTTNFQPNRSTLVGLTTKSNCSFPLLNTKARNKWIIDGCALNCEYLSTRDVSDTQAMVGFFSVLQMLLLLVIVMLRYASGRKTTAGKAKDFPGFACGFALLNMGWALASVAPRAIACDEEGALRRQPDLLSWCTVDFVCLYTGSLMAALSLVLVASSPILVHYAPGKIRRALRELVSSATVPAVLGVAGTVAAVVVGVPLEADGATGLCFLRAGRPRLLGLHFPLLLLLLTAVLALLHSDRLERAQRRADADSDAGSTGDSDTHLLHTFVDFAPIHSLRWPLISAFAALIVSVLIEWRTAWPIPNAEQLFRYITCGNGEECWVPRQSSVWLLIQLLLQSGCGWTALYATRPIDDFRRLRALLPSSLKQTEEQIPMEDGGRAGTETEEMAAEAPDACGPMRAPGVWTRPFRFTRSVGAASYITTDQSVASEGHRGAFRTPRRAEPDYMLFRELRSVFTFESQLPLNAESGTVYTEIAQQIFDEELVCAEEGAESTLKAEVVRVWYTLRTRLHCEGHNCITCGGSEHLRLLNAARAELGCRGPPNLCRSSAEDIHFQVLKHVLLPFAQRRYIETLARFGIVADSVTDSDANNSEAYSNRTSTL